MLFFDIDGTILFHNRVPLSVKKAIKRAQKAGHYCFINTGRSRWGLPKSIKGIAWDGYLCVGSYVEFHGEVLDSPLMPRESVEKIMELVAKDRIPTILDRIGPSRSLYCDRGINKLRSPEEVSNHFEEMKINKFELLHPLSGEVLDALAPYASCFPMGDYVDVFVLGYNKASGMKLLGEKLNIPQDRMIAFGDNNNDLDMLRYAGKSVAMKNASEEAVRAATYHATKRRVGVRQGIKKYLGI